MVVDWMDAAGNTNWVDSDDRPMKVIECQTVGWVHSTKGNALSTYGERTLKNERGGSSVGSRSTIPKSCIRKVTVKQKAE